MKRHIVTLLLILVGAVGYSLIKQIKLKTKTVIAQEKDSLVVGTNAEFRPFAFVQEDGSLDGFDIDIARAIGNKLGMKVTFKDLPFESLIAELQNGSVDFMAAGISPTPERAKQIFFTDSVYEGDPLIIVYFKDSVSLETVNDLQHKKVIVNEGYFADSFLTEHGITNLVRLSSAQTADGILALQNKQADAFVGSKATTLPVMSNKQKELFAITVLHDIAEKDAIGVAKFNKDLLNRINNAIVELKKDGTLPTLIKKWFDQ